MDLASARHIGAGLAMLFPRTRLETQVMGEAAQDMRDRFDEVASVAAGQVDNAVQDLKAEAKQIGSAARAAAGPHADRDRHQEHDVPLDGREHRN